MGSSTAGLGQPAGAAGRLPRVLAADGKPGPVRGLRFWCVPINGMSPSAPQLGPRSSRGIPCLRGGFSLGTAGGTKLPARAARGMGWREETQPRWHPSPHPPSCPVGPCTAPSFQATFFFFCSRATRRAKATQASRGPVQPHPTTRAHKHKPRDFSKDAKPPPEVTLGMHDSALLSLNS